MAGERRIVCQKNRQRYFTLKIEYPEQFIRI